MKLSVPLIVKNEAAHLAGCLGSVRSVADEIIVLDTGSKDGTIDVARQHADKVCQSKRFNADTSIEDFHFADARNEVLDMCSGDWILSIDADERLVEDGLRPALNATAATCCSLYLHMVACKGRMAWVPRIFRRNGVRWKGRYHDKPHPWDREAAMHLDDDVCHLDNYANICEEKQHRNLVLLKRQMVEEKHIGETTLQLAEAYRAMGPHYYAEALGHYEAYYASFGDLIGEAGAYLLFVLADSYSRLGSMQKAINLAMHLIQKFPRYARGYLVLAEVYQAMGENDLAISYYQRGRDLANPMQLHPSFEEDINREAIDNRIMLCDQALQRAEPER